MFSLHSLHKIDKTQDENIRKYFLAEGKLRSQTLYSFVFVKILEIIFFFLTKNLFFLVRVWHGEQMEIYFMQLLSNFLLLVNYGIIW